METPLTEREWVGRAIKYRRTQLGMRQKDLAALITEIGPAWSQGILAKVENFQRDISLFELSAVCLALGTTPDGLLFPVDAEGVWVEEVVPEVVTFPTGKTMAAVILGEQLDNNPITGTTAEAWDIKVHGPNPIDLMAVLDNLAEVTADPDAVVIAEWLKITPEEVTETVTDVFREGFFGGRRRKRVTAREVVDLYVETWRREHPDVTVLDGAAYRQVRTKQQRQLAYELEDILGIDEDWGHDD